MIRLLATIARVLTTAAYKRVRDTTLRTIADTRAVWNDINTLYDQHGRKPR